MFYWINAVPSCRGQQIKDIERPKNDLRIISDVKNANRALAPKEFSGKVWTIATLDSRVSEWFSSVLHSFGLPWQVDSKQY